MGTKEGLGIMILAWSPLPTVTLESRSEVFVAIQVRQANSD